MVAFLVILQVLVAFFLILVVLLQPGNRGGAGAALGGGGGETVFGGRGANTFLAKLTLAAAVMFMVTNLSLSFMSGGRSVLDTTSLKQPTPAAAVTPESKEKAPAKPQEKPVVPVDSDE